MSKNSSGVSHSEIGLGLIGVVCILTLIGSFINPKANYNPNTDKDFQSESYRKSVRDAMISNGTNPAMADEYTKQLRNEQQKKQGIHPNPYGE